MRSREEVLAEIDWREKEIEEIYKNKKLSEYHYFKIGNLNFSIEWCKWFLNDK